MMTQPAAATSAAPNAATGAGAGAGADPTGTAGPGSGDDNVFSQALQALVAGGGNAAAATQGGDASIAETAANAAPANASAGDAALLEAVKVPNVPTGASSISLGNAGKSDSPNAKIPTDTASQVSKSGSAVSAMAKDLLQLLFAKPSVPSTASATAPRGGAVAGDDADSNSAADASQAPGSASGVLDSSAVAATLLTQLPIQLPATVALKWQEPPAAQSGRESPAAPLSTAIPVAFDSNGGASAALHPAIAATLTRTDDASSVASLLAPQGAAADTTRAPRIVADADSFIDTSGMAAALRATNAGNAANAAPVVEHAVAVPVHDRHWPTAMAAQVLILSGDKVRAATLRLTPEHLGPLEVRIDMQDSSVNVNFTAAHAETRAALEQAMPQLRSVLAGAGLTLGQATVQQQARHGSQNPQPVLRGGAGVDEVNETPVSTWRALGLVDEYA